MALDDLQPAVVNAGLGLVGLTVIAIRLWKSKRPPEWFGIKPPSLVAAAIILIASLCWMLGTDAMLHWRGPWDFRPWQTQPIYISILRIAGVCVFGPIIEEFVFRAVIYAWLQERMPVGLTIALTAISWALVHWSYTWAVILVIVVEGILLGVARWKSDSLFAPIAMHMTYNIYAVW